MKKMLFIMLTLSASIQAESISIDLNILDKAVVDNRAPMSTVTEILPADSSKTNTVIKEVLQTHAQEEKRQETYRENITSTREISREDFLHSLRAVIEKGKDFKYYFPNFDYGQSKKDIEQMMRDAVSQ
jgi:hypothetical protein